eukprot:CAMPEP_0180257986 /NCGR_PEP_ID=MMETSP0987-20121128/42145_1 /TAXON_ID=697907 /ORGANISM="non described non described, Strain CCMP2293" /LENGTH=47 /DNA_ID= /DNA_START= /DNA_END= /DNA_ORIENTATION=
MSSALYGRHIASALSMRSRLASEHCTTSSPAATRGSADVPSSLSGVL